MTTKYEVLIGDFEIRMGHEEDIPSMSALDIFDLYWDMGNKNEILASFNTKEEALACLYSLPQPRTYAEQTGSTGWSLLGDVAYVSETRYTDDEEYDSSWIIDYRCEPYTSDSHTEEEED